MKYVRILLVIAPVAGFMMWSNDPADDIIHFIIGGTIPGTKQALGFWPILLCIFTLVCLYIRFARNLRLQMLEHTAKQITAEKQRSEFQDSFEGANSMYRDKMFGQQGFEAES